MRQMDTQRYEKFRASGRLPSPKGVALAIIRLLRRDDYQIGDLVRLLQSDPAIAGRLLKFANSAALGQARPIVAIAKAVLILGAHRVRDLVLGFSILQAYRGDGGQAFRYETFWSRSLATAIAAQALSKHAQIAAEEAFTLGLLCDVGMLALAAYDPARFDEAVRRAGGNAERLIEAEHGLFEADHRELGAALMTDWGLPETLTSAAFHCEAPDAGGLADGSRRHVLALSLYFARSLAAVCVAGATERWAMLPELCAKAARLGIAPDELTSLADDVAGRWREWGATLEIHTQHLPPFAEILASVPPHEAPQIASEQGRRAIIVGADAAHAAELAGMLEALGHAAACVPSGIDGLMLALRDHPERIFVDIDSHELDGTSFCRAFRASPLAREAHLVLFGGHEHEERMSQAIEAGADDYLVQPVSVATLRVRLHAADKIAHLREEIRRERRGLMRSAGEWAGSQRRMMEVALTDPLTRLPNRRYGLDFLAAESVFAHAHGRPLACLMVDVDHFKAINDTHGHDAGDAVLACVGQILVEQCRSADMAFRYGGEEFCVVCSDTDLDAAHMVAERIRNGIELESGACGGRGIGVTVSIGIAVTGAAISAPEKLLKAADAALYRAKENGRNRVEH